jgi:hypothetical protein
MTILQVYPQLRSNRGLICPQRRIKSPIILPIISSAMLDSIAGEGYIAMSREECARYQADFRKDTH